MSTVEQLGVPGEGPPGGRRPVWAGVAVRYDDGTIAAWQINHPTDGRLVVEREYDEPVPGGNRRVPRETILEITVRGPAMFWQPGADQAVRQQQRRIEPGRQAIEPEQSP